MLVSDLDGKESKWTPRGKEVVEDTRPRSKGHVRARDLLKARFPSLTVLEEVQFKPRKGKTLYLDFYLPLRKLAIEVHGAQHFAFNTMFHSSRADFMQQQRNDRDKEEWCKLNGIQLVVLKDTDIDNWETVI